MSNSNEIGDSVKNPVTEAEPDRDVDRTAEMEAGESGDEQDKEVTGKEVAEEKDSEKGEITMSAKRKSDEEMELEM